jgi:hypothetical protein
MTEQEQELRSLYRRLQEAKIDLIRLRKRMPWEPSPGASFGLGPETQQPPTWTTQTTPEPSCKRLFLADDVCSGANTVFRVSWSQPLPWVDQPDSPYDFDVSAIVQSSIPLWDCYAHDITSGDYSSYAPDTPPMTPGWSATSSVCSNINGNAQIDSLITYFLRNSLSYKVALQLRVGLYDFNPGAPYPVGGLRQRYFFEINAGSGLYMQSLTNVGYAELGDFGPPLVVGESRRLDYWTPFSGTPQPGTAEYVTLTRIS